MTPRLTPPDQEPKKPDLRPPDAENFSPQKSNLKEILLIAFTLFALLDIAILAYIYFSNNNKEIQQPVQEQTRPAGETAPPVQKNQAKKHL